MRFFSIVSRVSSLGLYAAMAMTFAIMLLVTLDVISRNLFNSSITGTVELTELMQGLVVFFGVAATFRAGGHIAADFIVERLSIKAQAMTDLLTNSLSLMIFALMTYALYEIATGPGAAQQVSELLDIPMQPFKLVAAIGIGLMCLEIVRTVAIQIEILRGNHPEQEAGHRNGSH